MHAAQNFPAARSQATPWQPEVPGLPAPTCGRTDLSHALGAGTGPEKGRSAGRSGQAGHRAWALTLGAAGQGVLSAHEHQGRTRTPLTLYSADTPLSVSRSELHGNCPVTLYKFTEKLGDNGESVNSRAVTTTSHHACPHGLLSVILPFEVSRLRFEEGQAIRSFLSSVGELESHLFRTSQQVRELQAKDLGAKKAQQWPNCKEGDVS